MPSGNTKKSSSEYSWFVAVSVIAVMNVCTVALAFRRFLRANADFLDVLALVGLLSVTLYAWFTPRTLLRTVESNGTEVSYTLLRKTYGLSIAVLFAVQMGLVFAHPLHTLR